MSKNRPDFPPKDRDWVVLEGPESNEGMAYRFDDKEFILRTSLEGGFSILDVSLTKEQASLLRFHLGNWLLDQEKGE